MNKKIIYLKVTLNSEIFNDISDSESLKLLGITTKSKEGVFIEQIAAPCIIPQVKDASPKDYAQIKFNDDLDD